MKKVLSLGLFFISMMEQGLLSSAKSLESLENKSAINTQLDVELCSCSPVVKFALPALLVGKVGYDLSYQFYYRKDICDIYERFEDFIKINNITSLSDAKLYTFFTEQDIQKVLMLEDWARNSYSSWLKPWNWTVLQKDNYNKIELLAMVILYGPLFVTSTILSGQNIIEHVRKTCCIISDYPLLHGSKILDEHIGLISTNYIENLSESAKSLVFELEQNLLNMKLLLISHKEYLYEFYTFKTHTLLEQIKSTRFRR